MLTDADMRQMKTGSTHDIHKDAQARSYDVLRQSLHEAQKRCQAYNENMLRVAHANDELAQTLNTVKNTNKRLVDQLQYQVGSYVHLWGGSRFLLLGEFHWG